MQPWLRSIMQAHPAKSLALALRTGPHILQTLNSTTSLQQRCGMSFRTCQCDQWDHHQVSCSGVVISVHVPLLMRLFDLYAGLPIGLQLIGRAWQEASLLYIGSVVESVSTSRNMPDVRCALLNTSVNICLSSCRTNALQNMSSVRQ